MIRQVLHGNLDKRIIRVGKSWKVKSKKTSFEIEFEVTTQYGLIYIRGERELLQEDVWKWLEAGVNKFYIMELKLI